MRTPRQTYNAICHQITINEAYFNSGSKGALQTSAEEG